MSANPESVRLLEAAQAHAARGDHAAAERAYAALLERDPAHPEAATAISRGALQRGDTARAIACLERATAAAPAHPQLTKNLGVAYVAAGQLERARATLVRAVELQPAMFGAWLELGQVQERLGDRRGAVTSFLRAVTRAQVQGHWLDESTTPPWLVDNVLHAMDVVRSGRREIFLGLLAPLRERHGAAALARVERCLARYLNELALAPPDARQKPKFLYFPDVPSQPYYDKSLLPWTQALERECAAIRAEAQAVLDDPAALTPFLELKDSTHADAYLRGTDAPPAWDALFFYRHGERVAAGHARCPRTSAVLEALPLVRIGAHAPEICFSVLTAGTEILPHHGVSNIRLVVHLPLIVPRDCAIEVGGERHDWREGECVVFDDTFEHRAWNRSDRTRVILLMDAWNPHLTEVEREAVTLLIEEIGVIDRG